MPKIKKFPAPKNPEKKPNVFKNMLGGLWSGVKQYRTTIAGLGLAAAGVAFPPIIPWMPLVIPAVMGALSADGASVEDLSAQVDDMREQLEKTFKKAPIPPKE